MWSAFFLGSHSTFRRRDALTPSTRTPSQGFGGRTNRFPVSHDGDLDIAATSEGELSVVRLFCNDGAEFFVPCGEYSVGRNPSGIASTDLDSDGRLDLVVTSRRSQFLTLLMGREDKGFESVTMPMKVASAAVLAEDLNGDGRVDLAVSVGDGGGSGGVRILLQGEDGEFMQQDVEVRGQPRSIVSTDLDQDQDRDLVCTDFEEDRLLFFRNDGSGRFEAQGQIDLDGQPIDVAVADFDEDGFDDYAATIQEAHSDGVAILIRRGDDFDSMTLPAPDPSSVVAADLDDDGDMDLAASAAGVHYYYNASSRPSDVDCNRNGVPDQCDLSSGASDDSNGNQIPDDCESDCNGNGVPDDSDIASGTSRDRDGDGEPDECRGACVTPGDCDRNDVIDVTDAGCMLGFLFEGAPQRLPCGEGQREEPSNEMLLDWQGDGRVDNRGSGRPAAVLVRDRTGSRSRGTGRRVRSDTRLSVTSARGRRLGPRWIREGRQFVGIRLRVGWTQSSR